MAYEICSVGPDDLTDLYRAVSTALPATMYATSTGVTGPTITVAGSNVTAWVAHTQTTRTCAIYVGTTSLAPATKEGEPKCT